MNKAYLIGKYTTRVHERMNSFGAFKIYEVFDLTTHFVSVGEKIPAPRIATPSVITVKRIQQWLK
jgi:hypothetical protein